MWDKLIHYTKNYFFFTISHSHSQVRVGRVRESGSSVKQPYLKFGNFSAQLLQGGHLSKADKNLCPVSVRFREVLLYCEWGRGLKDKDAFPMVFPKQVLNFDTFGFLYDLYSAHSSQFLAVSLKPVSRFLSAFRPDPSRFSNFRSNSFYSKLINLEPKIILTKFWIEFATSNKWRYNDNLWHHVRIIRNFLEAGLWRNTIQIMKFCFYQPFSYGKSYQN